MRQKKIRISFNSPVVLGFTVLCFSAFVLGKLSDGGFNRLLFSVYRAPLTEFFTYIRFFGHILGHVSWEHFFGNITLILVIGPLLEEKYGSHNLLSVILITAFVTGLANFIFFPRYQLLGASGVVFAFILLASFCGIKDRAIPLTFILVAVVYMGGQLYNCFFAKDDIAYLTHLLGGLVGTFSGYMIHRARRVKGD